jgi:glycosyltransferase involved in cell wall biosynthesis
MSGTHSLITPDPTNAPLVSVIVSTYNSERFLASALKNLEQQTIADRIEIIIIDSGSTQNERAIVEEFQSHYNNIRYLRTERETIYQAWNRGIRLAKGKYVTNANTDDCHRIDALEVMAGELEQNSDIALVYADTAVTFEENQTFDAIGPDGYLLRPDYSPEIMLTGCHMGPQPMWRRCLHEELGYFREDLRSAGDYEFWCRVALRHQLKHIPQTLGLYYENPHGICNSDIGLSVREARTIVDSYRGLLPAPPLMPAVRNKRHKGTGAFVNIGMITYNRQSFTRQSIASLIKYTDFPYVLTVVDNASQDGSREYLQRLHDQGVIDNLILLDENVGVAKASNLAWHHEPDAPYYLKLDNDIVIKKPGWLGNMVRTIDKSPGVGVIGYNFEPISYPVSRVGDTPLRIKPRGNLGGACILIPRRTWEILGDWCEDYGLYGEEDCDYGLRVSLSGLLNAYMEDENIGDHLPAGKAALISPTTLVAIDGLEEHNEADYRNWKDQQRREHVKLLGAWERNRFAYSNGRRSLRLVSRFVAERAGAVDMTDQSGTGSARGLALIAGLIVKRMVISAKISGSLLQAAQQYLSGVNKIEALMAALRVMRDGGLGAVRTKVLHFLNQTVIYGKWTAVFDCLYEEDRRQIAELIRTMPYQPTFSILLPVYNPEPEHLEQAIASVLAQLYPHWKLCIADDASEDSRIAPLIERFCLQDSRISVTHRAEHGEISAASNSCLAMANGEFVALLGQDDLLAPHALYMAAQVLNHHPDLSLIYSDEDKINSVGVRSWPHFKPAWNPDLMRSQNAVNHLAIYRAAIVRGIDGFRIGTEGCQDWDLALRVSERIPATQIRHLPYVLYHSRITRNSTALSAATKNLVVKSGQKVLHDHLARMGVVADVLPQYGTYFRVKYRLDNPLPVAVISRFAPAPTLERLIRNLTKNTAYPALSLYFVIDTAQRQELEPLRSLAEAHNLSLVLVDSLPGTNSAQQINQAVTAAGQPVICLLDPECVPAEPDWLIELVSHAMRPEIGAAGTKLTNPDGTIYHGGIILGLGRERVAGASYEGASKGERGIAGRAVLIQDYSAVTIKCMAFRRDVFLEAGGIDAAYLSDHYADVDFCLRLGKLGYRILWTPYAEMVWHGSSQQPSARTEAAQIIRSRWQAQLDNDPAHNPNLSLDHHFPTLAPAPRVSRCSSFHG